MAEGTHTQASNVDKVRNAVELIKQQNAAAAQRKSKEVKKEDYVVKGMAGSLPVFKHLNPELNLSNKSIATELAGVNEAGDLDDIIFDFMNELEKKFGIEYSPALERELREEFEYMRYIADQARSVKDMKDQINLLPTEEREAAWKEFMRSLEFQEEKEQEKAEFARFTTGLSPEDREKLRQEHKELAEQVSSMRLEIIKYRLPELYHAQMKIRSAELEAFKDIQTQNSDELIDYFHHFLLSGDQLNCAAILRKLSMDGSLNEILLFYGYQPIGSGLNKFFREVIIGQIPKGGWAYPEKNDKGEIVWEKYHGELHSLRMPEQYALTLQDSISFTAEAKNQWPMARTIGKCPDGRYHQLEEEEHVTAVAIEVSKRDNRTIARNFNRAAFGGEVTLRKYDHKSPRDFMLSKEGLAILFIVGKELGVSIHKGDVTANTIAKLRPYEPYLRSIGISRLLCDELRNATTARDRGAGDFGYAIGKAMGQKIPEPSEAAMMN